MRRGPGWSQSEGGPLAHVPGASLIPKRRRPPRPCGGRHGRPKVKPAPSPMRRGPAGSKAKEAPSPLRRGPQWSQSEGGPLAHAAGASGITKRRKWE